MPALNLSIKGKLQAIILITALSVLLLSLLVSVFLRYQGFQKEALQNLQSLAAVLGENSLPALTFVDQQAANKLLQSLNKRNDIIVARIFDNSNRLFAEYIREGENQAASIDQWWDFLPARLKFKQAILSQQRALGRVELIADLQSLRNQLNEFILTTLVIFAVSFLLAIFLSSRLQYLITDPVERLLTAMQHIKQSKRFDTHVEKTSEDELGQLVDAFNAMLEQINEYDHKLSAYQRDLEDKVRRRTLQLEEAKLAAEAGNRAKSNFLAMMSHEIRTPMNGVVGFASLLRKTRLDEQQMEQVNNIFTSAELLLAVINDILDFSRMESGKLQLVKRDFTLEKLLRDIQTFFRPLVQQKNLQFHLSVNTDVPMMLHGDDARIRQMLNNLISNAIKFTEQGAIDLLVSVETLDHRQYRLTFEVNDTGVGIAPEFLKKLFRSFEQGDTSVARRFGGSGLGLVIARNIAQLMQGEIHVKSTLGIGSVFTASVILERAQKPLLLDQESMVNRRSTEMSSSFSCLEDLKALLVDDDPINLTLGQALLKQIKMDVVAVDSGAAALEQIAQQAFDIVLLDLEMPELDGIEVVRQLRTHDDHYATVPVIALTAHAFPEKRQEAINAGMNDLLPKPYRQENLYAIVAHWCCADVKAAEDKVTVIQAVINRKTLLEETGSEQLAEELLQKFYRQLPLYRQRIRSAVESADYQALYAVIHKVTSSAGTVAAEAIHHQADYLQQVLKQDALDYVEINNCIPQLLDKMDIFEKYYTDLQSS